jgi:TIR domain
MVGQPKDSGEVFISYSWDSEDHVPAVLELSNRLRSEGVDCVLDQYEESPPEGWPRWMDRKLYEARLVLVVCTEAYYNRVMGKEVSDKGSELSGKAG